MKDIFAMLVKSLTEQKVITEDKATGMIDDFAKRLDETTKKIYEDAYGAAEEKLEKEHGEKLEELLKKLDADAVEKLQQVVDFIESDHGRKLKEIIATVLDKQDEEHGEQMQQVLDKVDADATEKMQTVVDKIDDEATKKLETVKEWYETKYKDIMVEKLDKYFETYLEAVQPKEVVLDAAKLERLEKSIAAIKEILMINDDFVQGEVKQAVAEAKDLLDAKDSQINKLMIEMAEIRRTDKIKTAKTYLESRIEKASPKLRAFLEVTFKNATSKDEIEAKFDEAVSQFKKEEDGVRNTLIEDAKNAGVKPAKVITENLVQHINPTATPMDMYVNLIKKSNKGI